MKSGRELARSIGSLASASPASLSRDGHCQIAAGRKAHEADPIWFDLPLVGARAHRADGPFAIGDRVAATIRRADLAIQTILEHRADDPAFGEPAAHGMSLMVGRQHAMSAAGRDDDRGSGCLLGGRQINRERRIVNLFDPAICFVPCDGAFRSGAIGLRAGAPSDQSLMTFGSWALATMTGRALSNAKIQPIGRSSFACRMERPS